MFGARGRVRVLIVTGAATTLGVVAGCREKDAVFGPLEDTTPPVVSIVSATQSRDTLIVTVSAHDAITVTDIITELRVHTPGRSTSGDTLVLGRLLAADTTRFSGRKVSVKTPARFPNVLLTTPSAIDVRAVARDPSGNEGVDIAMIGTPPGRPQVSITSPSPGQMFPDGTPIPVEVQASDADVGLASLEVSLSGAAFSSETIQFGDFRSEVDTVLDFFIPGGAAGQLTISVEAINRDGVNGLAEINVIVSATATGGAAGLGSGYSVLGSRYSVPRLPRARSRIPSTEYRKPSAE